MSEFDPTKFDHIPTEEVERDIADTEREIRTMTDEAEWLEKAPYGPEGKMSHFRASGRRQGIKERQEFIAKLRLILDYRRLSGVRPR